MADSGPAREYEETLNKARALLHAEKRRAEGVPTFAEAAARAVEAGSGGGAVLLASVARGRAARLPVERRDWAAEETGHPREVAETALAHKVRSRVEAARQGSRPEARSDPMIRRVRNGARWPSREGYFDGSDPWRAGARM